MSYTPNFAGVIEALKAIINNGSTGGGSSSNSNAATATNQQAQIGVEAAIRDTGYEIRDTLRGRISVDTTKNLSQIPAQSRAASGDFVLIPAPPTSTQRIKVYGLTLQLNGTTENLIIVRDGGEIRGRHLLVTRGDQSGFICDFPGYVTTSSNALILNFSSASEVFINSVFFEYF